MRIGIDARFYGSVGKGLGRYTQKLIENLENIDKKNQYFIFLRKENWDFYKPCNPNFIKILTDFKWYSLVEQIFMPYKLYRQKLDLVHFPHFNVPLFYRKKFVVTIHDLILIRFPTEKATTLGPFLYKIKQWGYKIVIHSAVERAEKVIAVSRFTKNDLIQYFKLPPQKIIVTYEGGSSFVAVSEQKEVLKRYKISKPYILYVGNAYPHKNLENLLLAVKILIEKKGLNLQLVLVGKKDYFFKRLAEKAKSINLLDKNVVFTGFVSDQDLRHFYQNALVYVFPSFYEGFGLPPLEAMAQGLPVVSSKSSCLPEILGDAAFYFNPSNVNDIALAIEKVAKDDQVRSILIKKGLECVKRFSWERCAQQTIEVYKEAIKRQNSG